MARTLEIALANRKGDDNNNVKYDIVNIDFTDGDVKLRTRLGKEFLVSADEPAPQENASDVWRRFMYELPWDFAEEIGGVGNLVSWAEGLPATVGGVEYATMNDFLNSREAPPTDFGEKQDVPETRVVERVSEDLVAALGFRPKLVIQLN